jgi:SynChlorMet cassette protein ScmC
MALAAVLARDAQSRGGVLLHGALAEKDGVGVILAAPSGTGKSTASGRLPPPWRSRCDDATLVVRDPRGGYRAHPWPTWSRFAPGGPGGGWNVQDALPLKGVFFLSRSATDRVEPAGAGRATGLLVECAGQVSRFMARGMAQQENRDLQLERFGNVCALAPAVPAHVLHISPAGAFWREIDRQLAAAEGDP